MDKRGETHSPLPYMQTTTPQLIVGTIGSPYGVKGWLNINSYTDPAENILSYDPWLIKRGNAQTALSIVQGRRHGHSVVVQLPDCNDRDLAATYTGCEIAINRDQLAPLPAGEYYWMDLIGLKVINQQEITLGEISQVFATGANDVLVVIGDKRRLIPYLLKQVVLEIDLAHKTMRVDWDADF